MIYELVLPFLLSLFDHKNISNYSIISIIVQGVNDFSFLFHQFALCHPHSNKQELATVHNN